MSQGLAGQMSNLLEDKLGEFHKSGLTAVKSFFFSIFSCNPLACYRSDKSICKRICPIQGLFNTFGCLGSTIKKALKTIKGYTYKHVKKRIH